MTALPRRRRHRTWMMLVTTLVVAASIPALGYVGVRAILDSTGGRDAGADNLRVDTFPATPSGLYLTTDQAGTLSSATVFVLSPTGVGGSIVPVPVNADVGLSADARQSLQQVYADGGIDAVTAAVESLLLVTVDVSAVADPAQLTAFLTPFQPYTVELTSDVPSNDANESPLSAGTAVMQAPTAVRVLTAGAGLGSESSREGNIEAVWRALATAIGDGRTVPAGAATKPASFDELVSRVFAGKTESRGLPATPLTGTDNPTGIDVVQLDRSEAILVFASIAPASMSAPAVGPVVRLQAPPGYEQQVKATIDQLLFLHANVVSVDMTLTPQAKTIFLAPDESTQSQLQSTDEIFGAITFGTPQSRIDGVDVTIQLGTDYLDGLTA